MKLRVLFAAIFLPLIACGGAPPATTTASGGSSAANPEHTATDGSDASGASDGASDNADDGTEFGTDATDDEEMVGVYGGLIGNSIDGEGADGEVAQPPPPRPAALKPPEPPIYDRLRDTPGEVPGLPGFTIKTSDDLNRCGGLKITTRRSKQVAPDDKPLAEVFAIEFPTGLSFDPQEPKVVKASMERFKTWLNDFQSVGTRASAHYQGLVKSNDPAVRARAAARIVQVKFRLASVLGRAEIPADISSGEFAADKVDAYCDALADQARSLLQMAESDARACASIAAAAGPGWWTSVCRP